MATDTTKYKNIQWIKDNAWYWGDIFKHSSSGDFFIRMCIKVGTHDDRVVTGKGKTKEEALENIDSKLNTVIEEVKEDKQLSTTMYSKSEIKQ